MTCSARSRSPARVAAQESDGVPRRLRDQMHRLIRDHAAERARRVPQQTGLAVVPLVRPRRCRARQVVGVRVVDRHRANACVLRVDGADIPLAIVHQHSVAQAQRLTGGDRQRVVPQEGRVHEVGPAVAVGVGPGTAVPRHRVTRIRRVVEEGDTATATGQIAPARGHAVHLLVRRPVREQQSGIGPLFVPAKREPAVPTPGGERRAIEHDIDARA